VNSETVGICLLNLGHVRDKSDRTPFTHDILGHLQHLIERASVVSVSRLPKPSSMKMVSSLIAPLVISTMSERLSARDRAAMKVSPPESGMISRARPVSMS
jgi:hypothetical protein